MAHNLTEVDAFTTPITVPDGIDSRNNAAEVVAAIAQALANRTKHLSIHAAYVDAINVFTLLNQFLGNIEVTGDVKGFARVLGLAMVATNHVYTAGPTDADQTLGFTYGSAAALVPIARTSMVSIANAFGNTFWNADYSVGHSSVPGAVGDSWVGVPFRVPPGCTFKEIRVHHFIASDASPAANQQTFKVMARSGIGGAWFQLGPTWNAALTVGDHTTAVNVGSGNAKLVNEDDEYFILWELPAGDLAAIASSNLIEIEMDWDDVGPRNTVGS